MIEGITTGTVVDYGIKDSMNMGVAMAPAACEVIVNHMKDFGRNPSYYDCIVTGDLGEVGHTILVDLCRQKGVDISNEHEGLRNKDFRCCKSEYRIGWLRMRMFSHSSGIILYPKA